MSIRNGLLIASLFAATAFATGCAEGLDPIPCGEADIPCTVDEPPVEPGEPDPTIDSLAAAAPQDPEVVPDTRTIADLASLAGTTIDQITALTTQEVSELLSIPRHVAYDRLNAGPYVRVKLADHLVWGVTIEQLSDLEEEFWGGHVADPTN